MRSIQTTYAFPLSSVKPLEGIESYRTHCLSETAAVLAASSISRKRCPCCSGVLRAFGVIAGLNYSTCPECGSLMLDPCGGAEEWSGLLERVSNYRRSPDAFHASIAESRNENVYLPKLEWMRHTMRLHGLTRPRLLEIGVAPGPFTPVLVQSGVFRDVAFVRETAAGKPEEEPADAAVLLECLDRSADPAALLQGLATRLKKGGLLFITSLVSSGFDIAVLGLKNLYLYPPDRTNCFSLDGLTRLLRAARFEPVEVSTPGVLDVEIVGAHLRRDPDIALSVFERQILSSERERREAFQTFLQENLMSSFARIVARLS